MKEKKILIAETASEFADQLCEVLGRDYTLHVCHDGLSVTGLLEELCPHVLVMDLTLPGMDGISLLKQICTMPCRPRIVLTTCFMSSYVEAAIASLGVDMVMLKPCRVESIAERIEDLTQEPSCLKLKRTPGSSITSILLELKIPTKRRGFAYLEKAVCYYLQQPWQALTKDIYPQIAREYFTQPAAVERAIRQVIHESWAGRDEKVWQKYFTPNHRGDIPRPTNAEFISLLAEICRQSQEKYA